LNGDSLETFYWGDSNKPHKYRYQGSKVVLLSWISIFFFEARSGFHGVAIWALFAARKFGLTASA